MKESFQSRASRLVAAMRSSACGPLTVAGEVVAIVDNWPKYRAEAGGVEADAWLRSLFGNGMGVAFFRRRDEAVRNLDESVRRHLHHEVAVWVFQKVPRVRWPDFIKSLITAKRGNGDNPLSMGQARALYAKNYPSKRPAKTVPPCDTCAAKDAEIARLRALLGQKSEAALPAMN